MKVFLTVCPDGVSLSCVSPESTSPLRIGSETAGNKFRTTSANGVEVGYDLYSYPVFTAGPDSDENGVFIEYGSLFMLKETKVSISAFAL